MLFYCGMPRSKRKMFCSSSDFYVLKAKKKQIPAFFWPLIRKYHCWVEADSKGDMWGCHPAFTSLWNLINIINFLFSRERLTERRAVLHSSEMGWTKRNIWREGMLQDCKLLAFDELNGILNEPPNSNTCFEISQTQAPRAGKGKLIQQEQTAEIPPPQKKFSI